MLKLINNKDIILFGAPYDQTVTFKAGAAYAPQAIRQNFYGIETFSPYQKHDLSEVSVHDIGDLDLELAEPVEMVRIVEAEAKAILDNDCIPFMIGGEHLVALGAVLAAFSKCKDLCIVHFDAHADLRNDYEGQKYSHACVLRRCHDLLGDNRIWQFGVRSMDASEHEFIAAGHVETQMFGIEDVFKLQLPEGTPVYLTVDLDVLDPGEFPGTGTQEAGGVSFTQLLDALLYVINNFNVIAVDNVELAPDIDLTGRSTMLACKLLREELIALQRKCK